MNETKHPSRTHDLGPVNWLRQTWKRPPDRGPDYELPHDGWHQDAKYAHEAQDRAWKLLQGTHLEPGGPPRPDPGAVCQRCQSRADGHGHCWCCGERTEGDGGECSSGCPNHGDEPLQPVFDGLGRVRDRRTMGGYGEGRCRVGACFEKTADQRHGMKFAGVVFDREKPHEHPLHPSHPGYKEHPSYRSPDHASPREVPK